MTTTPTEICAPFTSEQVDALNRWQAEGPGHPFTCAALHSTGRSPVLNATHSGWICPDPACDYTQDWALAVMADLTAWPKLAVPAGFSPNPDAGLHQRLADALAEHRSSFTAHVPTEHACCAAAVLPVVAAERADARVDGLREAAAALQAVIDRDRAHPHRRGQSWIALGGAREIILGLTTARDDAITQEQA